MTVDELQEKMKDKPSGFEKYKEFFDKEIKDHLAGYWGPNSKGLIGVGERSDVRLVGGNDAFFHPNEWSYGQSNRHFGFSGRLLKN